MRSKYHSILLVPHSGTGFRKLLVSSRQLAALGLAAFAVLALAGFSTWTYFTTSVDLDELQRVRAENQALRETNSSLEEGVRELQTQISEQEARAEQLAIVAGLDFEGNRLAAGIGGGESVGDSLPLMQSRTESLAASFAAIERTLSEKLRWVSATPTISPARGLVTSGYGYRTDPIHGQRAFHHGIDIATGPGRPVIATGSGTVLRAGRIGNLGRTVEIAHGFGLVTRYGHLSRIDVAPGQRIERGDAVGEVGSTGRATGYHLHYEVRVDGSSANPMAYILDGTRPRS